MPRPHREVDAALQALYDQIPAMVDCKGLCWVSCGPIDMSQRERQRIRQAGFKITPAHQIPSHGEEYWCEALGPDGRCQVYALRPLLCRLWGTTKRLRCPYGCVPERWLDDNADGYRLLTESLRIGGDYADRGLVNQEAMNRALQMPEVLETVEQGRLIGSAGDRARARRHAETLPEVVTRRKLRKPPDQPPIA